MSHVATVDIEVRDLEALEKASKKLGLEFVKGQRTYKWWGRHVGDYPLPQGFDASDLGRCEHAIRIPGNRDAYEVGVVKRRDGRPGYTLLWDFYAGGRGLQKAIGEEGGRLKQAYAEQVAVKQMLREGWRLESKQDAAGNVLLTFVQ